MFGGVGKNYVFYNSFNMAVLNKMSELFSMGKLSAQS